MTLEGGEVIRLVSSGRGWLADYERALGSASLGDVSRQVVLEDSQFIADRAAVDVTDARWGGSRVRTGAVMGAVQSGKTASMIGVVARSLDNGVNVVVVLAGTQVTLWRQSMSRIQSQLDGGDRRLTRRIFLPNPDQLDSERRSSPSSAYSVTEGQAVRALSLGRPIIFVAMKQVDHLLHLGQVLHQVIYPAAEATGTPVRLLVVDDEADDSSVADDGLPWGSPGLDVYKQVPRRIVDLWEHRSQPGRTASENLFATYVAYTATPQANFLQDPQNPLSPRDFVASLRTPGPHGAVHPRTLTYRVPEGLRGWYTGADVFYGELVSTLCVTEEPPEASGGAAETDPPHERTVDRDELVDATRAYLVAAAIRLSRTVGRLGPASARLRTFASRGEVERGVAPVSSMLIHPSSAMESHFDAAGLLQSWWDGDAGRSGSGVLTDLVLDEPAWIAWLDRYRRSSERISDVQSAPGRTSDDRSVPEWTTLRQLLVDEVVPGTSIAVVNSDPSADERPSFSPWEDSSGWHAPRNHSTIFVSGNVMSRGLTLEGLLTTLFARTTSTPLADTQMQMQRWFGYRGTYIDLCRVFLSREQLTLFTSYADTDHALRSQVLAAMDLSGALPDFTVLQGQTFQATGKVSGIQSRQLRPGSRPFVRHLNPPGEDDRNLTLVSDQFLAADTRGRLKKDPRGLVALDELSLLDCADLLDRLHYADHGLVPAEATRWSALERQTPLKDGDPEFPLYRAPALEHAGVDLGSRSPYVIAAYLRFWSACLDRDVRGLFTDGDTPQRWSLLNRDTKRSSQPRFRLGVRFGTGAVVSTGPFVDLGASIGVQVRPMARRSGASELAAEWGSRKATSTGYVGDDLFDAALLGEDVRVHPDGTRIEGAPGLLLFHLVERAGGQAIAIGLSIPRGGPDHMEAVSTLRRNGTRTGAIS